MTSQSFFLNLVYTYVHHIYNFEAIHEVHSCCKRIMGGQYVIARAACVCMSTQLFCIWCIKNGLDGRFFKGLENRKNWLSAESWRSWCTGRGPILYNDPRQLRQSFFTVCNWTLCTFGSGHHFFTLNSYTTETC